MSARHPELESYYIGALVVAVAGAVVLLFIIAVGSRRAALWAALTVAIAIGAVWGRYYVELRWSQP